MSIKRLLIVLEIVVLAVLIFWHFKLGLVRYFDADEYAHLHWGYSLSVGERPYTDFFYLFPPFFLYPIAALFKIFGRTTEAILNARMFIFIIFLASSGILFLLAKKLRGTNFALLTLIFFAFLPLPFDKLIEVRPDLLAAGLAILGLFLFIKGNEGDKRLFFFSGLSYAASLGFVPKTIFFLVPVGIVFLISQLSSLSHLRRDGRKNALLFFLGMLPVGLLLLGMILSFGNLPFSLYSMTKMASDVTKTLGVKFFMRPDIFFYPNDTYYGFGGWSVPLAVNLLIYFLASVWGIGRFISSLSHRDGKECMREFLVAGTFFANLVAFVDFYPLKHAQYLIPVAPFIAFYFADLWESAVNKLPLDFARGRLKSLKLLKTGTTLALLVFLVLVSIQMNQKKAAWVNTPTFGKINDLMRIVSADAPIFDLTGESVVFKNGYYFCCLPYGQYEESLYFKLPDIEKELTKRNTNYIYLGTVTRLNEIPLRHAKYIIENFVPVTADKLLLKRKID